MLGCSIQSDQSFLQPDESQLQSDEPHIQPHQPHLLSNEPQCAFTSPWLHHKTCHCEALPGYFIDDSVSVWCLFRGALSPRLIEMLSAHWLLGRCGIAGS